MNMVDQFGRWYPDFPGQQPFQDPAYIRAVSQPVQNAHAQQQATMTPPTRHAEIVQVADVEAIDRFPIAAGTTQMFMTRDDEHIVIRSMYANGEHTDDIYDRRPPAPPAPTLNPDDYVRRDELKDLIAEVMQNRQEKIATKAISKKEAE